MNPSIIIPDFTVTSDDDQPSEPPLNRPRGVSDANLLSPTSPTAPGRLNVDLPYSPAPTDASSYDGSSIPPSPTLSNRSSVHFNTTLALRDNKPDARSGSSSLGLLTPSDITHSMGGNRTHHRKSSNATFVSSEGTEADNRDGVELDDVKSNTTSITHVDHSRPSRETRRPSVSHSDTTTTHSDPNAGKKGRKVSADDGKEKETRVELAQDENTDPTPFRFKPYELAHMLDPKDLGVLERLGGVDALLRGLGTSADRGLSNKSLDRSNTKDDVRGVGPGDGRPGAGDGASPNHEPQKDDKTVPAITLTEPGGAVQETHTEEWVEEAAFAASLATRRHIYGENVLPTRKSKSLLQLMFAALKDKVLVG